MLAAQQEVLDAAEALAESDADNAVGLLANEMRLMGAVSHMQCVRAGKPTPEIVLQMMKD